MDAIGVVAIDTADDRVVVGVEAAIGCPKPHAH